MGGRPVHKQRKADPPRARHRALLDARMHNSTANRANRGGGGAQVEACVTRQYAGGPRVSRSPTCFKQFLLPTSTWIETSHAAKEAARLVCGSYKHRRTKQKQRTNWLLSEGRETWGGNSGEGLTGTRSWSQSKSAGGEEPQTGSPVTGVTLVTEPEDRPLHASWGIS